MGRQSDILVAVEDPKAAAEWAALLRARAGARAVRLWPDAMGDLADIGYACVWRAPHGLLARLPNLKAVINIGAGADHLLADPNLPDVPVARAAHPDLTMRVTEYVVLHVLRQHRRQPLYDAQQRERRWQLHPQPAAHEVTVGIMGLGVIGAEAAQVLARVGFKVIGWSRTPKTLSGVESFHGAAGLDRFLARTEILVCLLPHTPETERLIDLKLLRKLKRDGAAGGAVLINAGRGALQVDADILAALDEGALAAATLDVFPEEPLPASSPLWTHPRVTVTPHAAGDVSPPLFADHIMAQIERCERGQPLEALVDRRRGY
jgi:glyoxylate/hydroxypyruvate reductase A